MLAYRRYGKQNSIPLVMIHGFLCGGQLFHPNIKYLSQYIDIITIDLPGFAESNHVISPSSIKEIATQVMETIELLNIEKYYLLGHSMGGMVVLQMAILDQNKIAKLIPYATNSNGNLPERFESFEQSKQRFIDDGIEKTKRYLCSTWFKQGEQAQYFKDCIRYGGEIALDTIFNALDAIKSFDVSDQLDLITTKTLVLAAEQDRTYALHHLKKLAQNLPQAELKILDRCYHNAHLENPQNFNQLILDFINH